MSKSFTKIAFFFLIFFTMFGCKKGTNSFTEESEMSVVKSYAQIKLVAKDYNSINWNNPKKTKLKDGTIAYHFDCITNKMSYFTWYLKNKKVVNAHMFKSTFDNTTFKYEIKNLVTDYSKIESFTISEILKTDSNKIVTPDPPGGITLPYVVVYGSLSSTSGNYSLSVLVVSDAMGTGGNNQNGQGVVEIFQPEEGAGGPSAFPFTTLAEALEFANFIQNLNPQELALLAVLPAAYSLYYYNNSKTALEKTQAWAASQCSTAACQAALLNNGKADAIRHAYWSALNKSDMGDIIAKGLGDAHENGATKPSGMSQALWDLQKTMDLTNNIVGRNFPYTLASGETIWDKLLESINTGGMYTLGLVYLCDVGGPGTESIKLFSQSCP